MNIFKNYDNIFSKIQPTYASTYFATQIIETYFNENDEKIKDILKRMSELRENRW